MTTQEIVSKLWNLCNVLRDDGITYHQYVTGLTYILFLKMAKETGAESQIPEAYRWDSLTAKSGIKLKKFYKELLNHLGENCTGRVREIYQGAATNIDEPKNLEKIITTIDGLDWFSAREEGLGNLYEGLLEKNANEKKSGAGQYFTPRVLIDVITRLTKPQPGERCNDPACGTFGFMIAAHQYVSEQTDEFYDLDADTAVFERTEAFTGTELVHDTHRLALMNAMLHNMEGTNTLGDTLSNLGKSMRGYNVLFFTRGRIDKGNTQEVWFYDLRTNMPSFGKTSLLKAEHFAGFEAAFEANDCHAVQDERWSMFTREQIAEKGNSLDLGLIRDDSVVDYDDLPDPIASGEEAIAQLEEAVDLLHSVVNELKMLSEVE
ncbi:MAG: SAM-dependent DNA methyltransferase [Oscillospiraceae bacterium]|nr:SAM-dependent DNA methyltransferase [Oscillospiraceae bacterium]